MALTGCFTVLRTSLAGLVFELFFELFLLLDLDFFEPFLSLDLRTSFTWSGVAGVPSPAARRPSFCFSSSRMRASASSREEILIPSAMVVLTAFLLALSIRGHAKSPPAGWPGGCAPGRASLEHASIIAHPIHP